MSLYTTIHLHNVPEGRETEYADWYAGPHAEALARVRGFKGTERYSVSEAQIMPDIAQPWRFMSIYDFDLPTPNIDLPALGPLVAEARDNGLIIGNDTERLYSYRMYSDWKGSPNWQRDQPFTGVSIILGNYVVGRAEEYHKWYDEVHSLEVTNVPGHVAMNAENCPPYRSSHDTIARATS